MMHSVECPTCFVCWVCFPTTVVLLVTNQVNTTIEPKQLHAKSKALTARTG